MKRLKSLLCICIIVIIVITEKGYSEAGATIMKQESYASEIKSAKELGVLPKAWQKDTSKNADFKTFLDMLTRVVKKCDKSAYATWNKSIDWNKIPKRTMRREDALVLIMLAAEALGYTTYNARSCDFCIENDVNYDKIFQQLSWSYPYCKNEERQILLYFNKNNPDEPIGNVPMTAVYYFQRRMDTVNRKHFLDYDSSLDFHLDGDLTRKAAIGCIIRFYNSENLTELPLVENKKMKSLLSQANKRIEAILSNNDTISCKGTAYYVSYETGNDQADGQTPQTAWKTLTKVNQAELKENDCVYFHRGELWRGQLWAKEGVTYSAYGTGNKPILTASSENGADPALWSLLKGTKNIWVYKHSMMDCGSIVLDEDNEVVGIKVAPSYLNGYRSTKNTEDEFDVKKELTENYSFFSMADSILYQGAPFRYTVMDTSDYDEVPEVVGKLYLRCDEGNPGEVFKSIEFMERRNIIIPADNTVIHNLTLKYCGSHAVFTNDNRITVDHCEIGWIGGSIQYYKYDNGNPARFGNGVESDGSYDRFTVTNCYIYQVYDAGISNQDPSEIPSISGNEGFAPYDRIQQNITYAHNVLAYCDMPIEIFFTLEDDIGYGRHIMKNVTINDNFMLYSGYGWAKQREEERSGVAALQFHGYPNASENFKITNNVLYLSTGTLINTGAKIKWLPKLSGNTYVQVQGRGLITWPENDNDYPRKYMFYIDTALDIMKTKIGDKKAVIVQ